MANKGTWITSGYRRGDLLIFHLDTGKIKHIEICTGINPDGSLNTIGGNTGAGNDANGGAVLPRIRYTSQLVGACRPSYPSTAVMEKIIAVAEAEAAAKVKEHPAGSNKVKYNTWYYGREVSGSAYPWCVVFVAWCFNTAGHFDLFMGGRKTASCTALATYYGYRKTSTTGGGGTVTITLDVMKKDSSGAQVATLQRLLNALGHDCGEADGEFGPKTDTAVRSFQKAEKLTVDGVVGSDTWTALLK
jgi:hypothetical protein